MTERKPSRSPEYYRQRQLARAIRSVEKSHGELSKFQLRRYKKWRDKIEEALSLLSSVVDKLKDID